MAKYPPLNAQEDLSNDYPLTDRFDCDTSKVYEKSKSVHTLRPSDIEIVGAFGDSLTVNINFINLIIELISFITNNVIKGW
jgi:hypothetical protein